MLSQIIRELRESPGPIGSSELSRRLGIEQSALDGMLETLVRQGKIKEVDSGQAACAYCGGSCQGCGFYRVGANMRMVYELAITDPPEKMAKTTNCRCC